MQTFDPTGFGLDNKKIKLIPLVTKIFNKINKEVKDLNLKYFLIYLLEDVSGKSLSKKKINFKDIDMDKKKIPGTIINQFAEILSPIKVLCDKKIFKDLPIDANDDICFPKKGEKLIDFKILSDNRKFDELRFSVKTGYKSNSVKPGDLIELIVDNKYGDFRKTYTKWKDSIELEILKILDKQSAIIGPISAIETYLEKFKTEKVKLIGIDELIESANKNDTRLAKENPEHLYEISQFLHHTSKSKHKIDFSELFYDAICNIIYYIKLISITTNGTLNWDTYGEKLSTGDLDKIKVAYLSHKHQKNSVGTSKMGLTF